MCLNPTWIYLPKALPLNKPHEEILKILRKPKFHYNKNYYARMIPCNTCQECRLEHANEWATRCYMESKTCKTGCFITLTYDNGFSRIKGHEKELNLPLTSTGEMTLKKKDLQDFWKRLRKKYPDAEIKYTSSGEYGPKNKRPHYHAVIFGWKPNDLEYMYREPKLERGHKLYKSKELYKLWGHGFVTAGELNYETSCYTARYTQKKIKDEEKVNKKRKFIPIANIQYDMEEIEEMLNEWLTIQKIEPEQKEWWKKCAIQMFTKMNTKKQQIKKKEEKEEEFILSSQKIGLQYWKENKETIKKRNGINVIVNKKPNLKKIPKYFLKKWEEENWEEYWNWKYQNEKRGKETYQELIKTLNYPKETPEWKKEFIYTNHKKQLFNSKIKALKRTNIK